MSAALLPPPVNGRSASAAAPRAGTMLRRVCHVSMTLQTGGLERLLVEFGRCHDAARYGLRFVALDLLGPPADDLRRMGFDVDSLQHSAVGKWTLLRRLANLLRREQIDIVHTHNTYAHFYGAVAAGMAGVPIVVNTQHGRGCGERWKDRLLFRVANRRTQRIVGVSEDAARLCRGQDRHSAGKIVTILNGIDVQRFTYHGPADTLTAVSVARLSAVKDIPTLLRGVAKARPQIPEFRLHIVGDGPERERLEQLTRELRLEEVVTFLGERSDVPALLRQAGFFVSSSKTEGISLTVLEAMAVGLPVLTTSVGGNPEIVVEGRTGRLVEPLNPDAIATGLIAMCRDQARWRTMGEAGRRRVEDLFEIRGMVRAYEALYAELERGSPGQAGQGDRSLCGCDSSSGE